MRLVHLRSPSQRTLASGRRAVAAPAHPATLTASAPAASSLPTRARRRGCGRLEHRRRWLCSPKPGPSRPVVLRMVGSRGPGLKAGAMRDLRGHRAAAKAERAAEVD